MSHARIAVALLLLVAACSDDGAPPPAASGGGTTASSSSSGGTTVDAGLADAGEPIGPALCEGLAQRSQDVAEYALEGDAPPPAGGKIAPGTYVLNELLAYGAPSSGGSDPPPPPPTGAMVRATMIVGTSTIRVLESRGKDAEPLPNDQARAMTYSIAGSELRTTNVCPSQGASKSIPFSAQGSLLVLYVGPNRVESYRRER